MTFFMMNRKDFIQNLIKGTSFILAYPFFGSLNTLMGKNMETKTKFVLHKANTRGKADHGWLKTFHTFSFANYYDPERMNFGALRVLNDDTVATEMGFGMHPHKNMEIITIPLKGELTHQDSMGNKAVITSDEIQVMSAGTGVRHSEFNDHKTLAVELLQIWVIPNKENVTPRYDQFKLIKEARINKFQQILSPNQNDEGVWIYQNAWFHLGEFTEEKQLTYSLKSKSNGVYVFIIEGEATVEGHSLTKRDGLGLSEINDIQFNTKAGAKILIMEVPL